MIRRTKTPYFAIILLALVAGVTGCDSTTDLETASLVGRWDGVGALQVTDDARGISISIMSDAAGVITGSWQQNEIVARAGVIAGGARTGDEIQLTLQGFPGNPVFVGRLTNQHRMAGAFAPELAEGSAVFRRGSIDP